MQSKANSVSAYLAALPPDRRPAIDAVRAVIRENLDADYEEGIQYGMIGYYVPHRVYPPGYHCDPKQPLPFAGLASQKNYMSVYLMSVYGDGDLWSWFRDAWAKTGKKLDMGKCCIRFKKLDDVALDVIGEAVRRVPVQKYIERYEALIGPMRKKAAAKKSKPPASKKPGKPAARKTAAVKPKPSKAAGKRPAARKKSAR